MTVHGTYDNGFSKLRDILDGNLESGADLGASVAVTVNGKSVVDMWGGWSDPGKTTHWDRDTITNVWSTTKTMTSLAALVLVDRGLLNLNEKVACYWPEFAANGKHNIEVRHLMSHTSGVSGWAQPVVTEDLYDWDRSTSMLAAQEPWWEPGTASGYHALCQGHLVGEVIRRITGLKLGEFFAKEIAGPLNADFHIGLPESQFDRVSNVVPPPPLPIPFDQLDPNSPMVKTFTGPLASAEASWTPAWRKADIGAANGHGNARSVARIQSIVACGGEVDGVRLLSPSTCERIFDVQADGMDLVLPVHLKFGIGYGLPCATYPYIPDGRVCFWGGWGGSMIIVDLDRRMTIAYMMNRMEAGLVGDARGEALISAAYDVVGR